MPAKPNTIIMRAAEKEIFRRLSTLLQPLGFKMTKHRVWTRSHGKFIDQIYLHRHGMAYAPYSTSASYRIHLDIRALDESLRSAEPKGLMIDIPPKGYHLGFNAKNEATFERCVTDLFRYCADHAEPWFKKFRDSQQSG